MSGFHDSTKKKKELSVPCLDVGYQVLSLESGQGDGIVGKLLVTGSLPIHVARSGSAQTSNMGLPSCGPTTCSRDTTSWVHDSTVAKGRGPWRSDPCLPKLALGTQDLTSLAEKEPGLVHEVERYNKI